MDNNYYENSIVRDPVVTFYRNGASSDDQSSQVTIKLELIKRMSFNSLFNRLAKMFNFQNRITNDCQLRLFDDQGVEIYQEDLKFIQRDTVLYASEGEEFDPASCFSEYLLIQKLGEGGFGNVLLGEHKMTKQRVAIKIVNTSIVGNAQDIDMVFREAEMLKSLRHKNIVNIFKCYTLTNMQVVFIMEFLEGGELLTYLEEHGKLSEDQTRVFIKQIAEAVQYCHQQKLIHRDLKLENILLAQKGSTLIKLVDFGIAGLVNNFNMDKIDMGSLKYMAPEALSGKQLKIGPSIDVWSIGCIMYALVTGQLPFNGKSSVEVRTAIMNLNYRLPLGIDFSLDFRDLISRILILDPAKRIKIGDILNHEWMTKVPNSSGKEIGSRGNKQISIVRETTVKFLDPPKQIEQKPPKEQQVVKNEQPQKTHRPFKEANYFINSKSTIPEEADDKFNSVQRLPPKPRQNINSSGKQFIVPYSLTKPLSKTLIRPFSQKQDQLNTSTASKRTAINSSKLFSLQKQEQSLSGVQVTKIPKQSFLPNSIVRTDNDSRELEGAQLVKMLQHRGFSSGLMKRSSQQLDVKLPVKHFRINSSRIGN